MGNAVDKIKSLGRFGSKLGLDRMNRLMAELGVSCADFKIIHVAGTNGKGSVCIMLDKILRAHGIKTGMYTSPYLSSYRDSIAVEKMGMPGPSPMKLPLMLISQTGLMF